VALSGNKVRKLEFVLAQAVADKADTVITCGAVQSNHARATAVAAARLGLQAHLVLRGAPEDPPDGNFLLDKLVNAEVSFVSAEEYSLHIDKIMQEKAEQLNKRGQRAFVIPEGASDELGAWGYIKAVEEILNQLADLNLTFDHIICATGSGGTQAGLIMGKALFNWQAHVHGINVCDDENYFINKINSIITKAIQRFQLPLSNQDNQIDIIDGYVGEGYGIASKDEIHLIRKVAVLEGIILDPVYTGKAMLGLADQIDRRNFRKGDEVLFLHSGGVFGLFPQKYKFFAI